MGLIQRNLVVFAEVIVVKFLKHTRFKKKNVLDSRPCMATGQRPHYRML